MTQIIFFCGTYLIYISVLFSVYFLYLKGDKKNAIKNITFLIGAAIVSWIIGHFLKIIIAHPRPDELYTIIKPDDTYSFPSGHASFMFALAFTMNYFSFGAGFILLLLAFITGIARVFAGVHFTYDIIGGAILGYLVSLAANFVYRKFLKKN